MNDSERPRLERCCYPFSPWAPLIGVLLLAVVALAWYSLTLRRERDWARQSLDRVRRLEKGENWRRQQDSIVARLRTFRPRVEYDDYDLTTLDLSRLVRVKGLSQLDTLLNNITIGDAGLEHVKRLTNLKSLDLTQTNVTDAGLEHLEGLTNLQTLNLWDTQVTDAGVVHLRKLTSLEDLCLGHTQLAGPGLKHLRGLTSLRRLQLQES